MGRGTMGQWDIFLFPFYSFALLATPLLMALILLVIGNDEPNIYS